MESQKFKEFLLYIVLSKIKYFQKMIISLFWAFFPKSVSITF